MNSDKDIRELLNNKLDNFESPVRPELWQNIASQVGTSAASGAGAGSSILTSTIGKIIIAAAVLTGVVTTLYFSNKEKSEKIVVEQTSIAHSDQLEKAKPVDEKIETSFESTPAPIEQNTNEKEHKKSPKPAAEPALMPDNKVKTNAGENTSNDLPDLSNNLSKGFDTDGGKNESTPNNSVIDNGKNNAVEKEDITAIFSVKAADPAHLKYFLFSSNIGNLSYKWTIDDEVKSTDNNFSITFDEQGIYAVKLEVIDNETGESAATTQEIKAFKPIKFDYPNAFSPGQNGKNDQIDFAEGCENESKIVSLEVRDMNNSLIYKSETAFIWDGRNPQGSICPAGPYIYSVIAIDQFGEVQSKSGRIQLFSE